MTPRERLHRKLLEASAARGWERFHVAQACREDLEVVQRQGLLADPELAPEVTDSVVEEVVDCTLDRIASPTFSYRGDNGSPSAAAWARQVARNRMRDILRARGSSYSGNLELVPAPEDLDEVEEDEVDLDAAGRSRAVRIKALLRSHLRKSLSHKQRHLHDSVRLVFERIDKDKTPEMQARDLKPPAFRPKRRTASSSGRSRDRGRLAKSYERGRGLLAKSIESLVTDGRLDRHDAECFAWHYWIPYGIAALVKRRAPRKRRSRRR